jgi:hypothetical protein
VNNINLELTINETNAILLALAKLPYETVAQLIDKIRTQSLPQVPEDQRNVTNRDKTSPGSRRSGEFRRRRVRLIPRDGTYCRQLTGGLTGQKR